MPVKEGMTLDEQLIRDGFILKGFYQNKEMPKKLMPVLVDIARGAYHEIRIIPGEIAYVPGFTPNSFQ